MRSLIPLVLLPTALHAQGAWVLTPYAARNGSLPRTPTLVGMSLARFSGAVGMRGGGAVDGRLVSPIFGDRGSATAWTADVDAVISPGRLPYVGTLLAGFVPELFAGIGLQGLRSVSDGGALGGDASWGATVSRRLGGGVSVETEARRRVPFHTSGGGREAGFASGWEYRLGISFDFGRSATRPSPPIPGRSRTIPTSRPLPGTATSARASQLLRTGEQYLGTRYLYGGSSPSTGFDCSGFVQYVYRRHDVQLPRTSREMAGAGSSLPAAVRGLRAGDLMLFASNGSRIDHVAIYAGDDRILHSSSSGGGVRYDDLRTSRGRWFVERLVSARRVMVDGRSLVDELVRGATLAPQLDPPDHAPPP